METLFALVRMDGTMTLKARAGKHCWQKVGLNNNSKVKRLAIPVCLVSAFDVRGWFRYEFGKEGNSKVQLVDALNNYLGEVLLCSFGQCVCSSDQKLQMTRGVA
eukprot:2756231-Amphidinium_carterae.1